MNANDVWYVEDIPRDKKIYTDQRLLWQRSRFQQKMVLFFLLGAIALLLLGSVLVFGGSAAPAHTVYFPLVVQGWL